MSDLAREPREVLQEFGIRFPEEVKIRVHDSTVDMRYVVLPLRPAGPEKLAEAELAALVKRDSLIGVTLIPSQPPEQTRLQHTSCAVFKDFAFSPLSNNAGFQTIMMPNVTSIRRIRDWEDIDAAPLTHQSTSLDSPFFRQIEQVARIAALDQAPRARR